jgi:hypothetical protein
LKPAGFTMGWGARRVAAWFCLALVAGMSAQATVAAADGTPETVAEAVAIAAELAKAIGTTGQAALAAKADRISGIPADWIVPCMAAFADATPAGGNWLRSGIERAVERAGDSLSADSLMSVVADRKQPARVRTLAFGWLKERDPSRAAGLLDGMLDDPALDLRREAVERKLAAVSAADETAQKATHRQCLVAARDVEQIERVAAWLSEHGEKVNVAEVLGFVRQWRVSEEFDNAKGMGFAKAYPPEAALPALPETGQWKDVASADKHGAIDLNAAIATKKGVLAYAVADVVMPRSGPAEVRIGSPCAVAVWVNGKPAMAHEIYHASEAIDQYVAPAEFREGTNTVMVKCCQNEQTEPWAADWKFQLRVCDPLGSPLATQPAHEKGPE